MLNGNCILVGKNANVPCLALTWCGGMALLHCAFASVGKKKEKVKCGITVSVLYDVADFQQKVHYEAQKLNLK